MAFPTLIILAVFLWGIVANQLPLGTNDLQFENYDNVSGAFEYHEYNIFLHSYLNLLRVPHRLRRSATCTILA